MEGNSCVINGVATIDCFFPIVFSVVRWAFIFSGTVSLIVIIIAGIRLILSGGDAKKIDGARKAITYAILGLLLVFFSYFILNAIADFTGVNCLHVQKMLSFQSCSAVSGGGSDRTSSGGRF